MENVIAGSAPMSVVPVGGTRFIELQKHRSLEGVGVDERRAVFSYALAVVLARTLPIPTAPVESVASYYMGNAEGAVREAASAFNEKIVIDYEIVRDFTHKLWCVRYFALHNANSVGSFYPYGFFDIVSGVGNNMDEKTYAYVNEHKVVIIDLSNAIATAFADK